MGRGDRQGIIPTAFLAATVLVSASWASLHAEPPKFATVPALAVSLVGGKEIGTVHYIVVQFERDLLGRGPTVLFSEASAGSAVDHVWKDGARAAMLAAAKVLREDARNWTVTIKNRSYFSLSAGSSASSAIAVGVIAAWRGDKVRSDVAVTGVITPDGRVEDVGHLPIKLQGAVNANLRAMLVPKGEARTPEWDLFELARPYNINIVEVATLEEAYEFMTGIRP